jgi:pimeloyl-ACP methyl ester carboxylesterase
VTSGAAAAREFLELDGRRLAYRLVGQPGALPTAVVLHGWGASIEAVGAIQDCLQPDVRSLAFDLPGFGQSDLPPAVWGSEDYARAIKGALDRLAPGPVSLIGHSRGGAIAIVLASRWPELIHRLVLVNSAGLRPTRSPAYQARVAAYKAARRVAGRGAAAEWLGRRFGSTDYRAAGPLRGTLVRVVNEDLRPLLPRIVAPTLLVWGDQDRETPLAHAAIMEREIPDAGLVVFPGAGHFSYADDLPRFCRVVGYFLKS